MGVVIDFADALNEMNEGQHLMELVSEVLVQQKML